MKKSIGKKPIYDKEMELKAVRLDPESIRKAKEIGDGNLSKGIRKLIEMGYDAFQFVKERGLS